MGERDVARIDPLALRDGARRYQSVADGVAGAVAPLMRWSFGAVCAGREYAAQGDALRAALDQSTDQIQMWSRAAAETAVALQVTADRYTTAEAAAASRIG